MEFPTIIYWNRPFLFKECWVVFFIFIQIVIEYSASKQWRPWIHAFCGIWSGSALFAYVPQIIDAKLIRASIWFDNITVNLCMLVNFSWFSCHQLTLFQNYFFQCRSWPGSKLFAKVIVCFLFVWFDSLRPLNNPTVMRDGLPGLNQY